MIMKSLHTAQVELQDDPEVTHGDLAMVFASGGIAQGVSCMLGKSC